jgi:hypothetical protein
MKVRKETIFWQPPKKVSFRRVEEKFEKNLFFYLTAQRCESSISNLKKISNVAEQVSSGIFYCSLMKLRNLG